MRANQRPSCRSVVKLSIRPHCGVMALFTRLRKARMIHGRLGRLISSQVAGNASRNRDVVVIVDVA